MRIAQTSRISRWVLSMLVLTALTACGAPQQDAARATSAVAPQAATLVPDQAPPAPTASQPPATGAPATSDDWPIYRSDTAGYSVAYPAGWAIHEQTDSGVTETTFTPSGGGAGITVSMQVADTESAEPMDMPNSRRCSQVVVGGITGLRCSDTVMLRAPAPPGGQGKSYIIASAGTGIDQALYQRFLDSFTPTQ